MKMLLMFLLFCPFFPAEADVEEEVSVVVLGGGVGALTAATYLARAGSAPIVITGDAIGGTIVQSHNVENWPGEMAISGLELSEKIRRQAEANGAQLREEMVISVDFSARPFLIVTRSAQGEKLRRYRAQTCIIAMGATPNLLGVPGESGPHGYWSRGVYSCAVCDGSLYRNKAVAVVGGGDAALIEAQYLSNIASCVHLIVRGKQFRTVEKQRMQEILSHSKIQVHFQTTVQEIQGDRDKVTHLVLQEGLQEQKLPVDALFLAIGAQPNTGLFKGQLELDPQGYLVLKKHQQTSIEGVYAIGDVADPEFKQAISAAGDAAKAALQAQQWIASHSKIAAVPIPSSTEKREIREIRSIRELQNVLAESKEPVFIDFYSTRCGPCRMFSPMYASWAKKHSDKILFLKVNADIAPEVFERYQIRGVPTVMVFDAQGQVVRKSVGLPEIYEIDRRLEKWNGSSALAEFAGSL